METPADLTSDPHPVVLVVDDEPALVYVVTRMLEPVGYRLLSATSGAEALEVTRSFAQPIDLLLTDLKMPEMTGRELSAALRRSQRDLKVLYLTAHSDDLFGDAMQLEEHEAFVEKPVTHDSLREAVALHLYGTTSPPTRGPVDERFEGGGHGGSVPTVVAGKERAGEPGREAPDAAGRRPPSGGRHRGL